ncbi:hypothetical protein, partial [Sinorhizobium meliloti]|uniref:hypothetical protein n=1 Tax=Rhizobium meliloti TaxID=382 RepID=UPI0012FD5C80
QEIKSWKTIEAAPKKIQQPPPSIIQPSRLKVPALQQLTQKLAVAPTPEAKQIVLDNIKQLVTTQKSGYDTLLPLLRVAQAKQKLLGLPPLAEVSGCIKALNVLKNAEKHLSVNKGEIDES